MMIDPKALINAIKPLQGVCNVDRDRNCRLRLTDGYGASVAFYAYGLPGQSAVDVTALRHCLKAFDGPIAVDLDTMGLTLTQDTFRVNVNGADRIETPPEYASCPQGRSFWPTNNERATLVALSKVLNSGHHNRGLHAINGHSLGTYASDGFRIYVDHDLRLPEGWRIPVEIEIPTTDDLAIGEARLSSHGVFDSYQTWINDPAVQVPDITLFFAVDRFVHTDLKALIKAIPKSENLRIADGRIESSDGSESRSCALPLACTLNSKRFKQALQFLTQPGVKSVGVADTGNAIVLTNHNRSVCLGKVV